MAEELSGQADSLQNTISFFTVDQTDGGQRRLIDRTGGNGGGHSLPGTTQHAQHTGDSAHKTASRKGASAPTSAASAPKGEATGITIPMEGGGNGGAGDMQDDEFEEY